MCSSCLYGFYDDKNSKNTTTRCRTKSDFSEHIVLAITHAILACFSSKWAQNAHIFKEYHVGNRLLQILVETGYINQFFYYWRAGNHNWWSSCNWLHSVRLWLDFRSTQLDPKTLVQSLKITSNRVSEWSQKNKFFQCVFTCYLPNIVEMPNPQILTSYQPCYQCPNCPRLLNSSKGLTQHWNLAHQQFTPLSTADNLDDPGEEGGPYMYHLHPFLNSKHHPLVVTTSNN